MLDPGNAVCSASDLAKYILKWSKESDQRVTNKKLQKLLYYCQGWYLALTNRPLFADRIEAWVHGPVVPAVYHEYKQFGYLPIRVGDHGEKGLDIPDLDVIAEVLDVYGGYDAAYLEWLSHNEPPWLIARAGLEGRDASNAQITPQSLFDYFSSLVNTEHEQTQS